jgi:UDP-N-acetylglucosamine 1-carboxyvinyltransferase
MGFYAINGGNKLSGEVNISGAKNAVLPILAASVLMDKCVLCNVPRLSDVDYSIEILELLGSKIQRENDTLIIDNSSLQNIRLDENLVGRMRSSFVFAGSLIGRFGCADIAYPGGCALGARPVDLHISSFSKLNIQPIISENGINFRTDGVKGSLINLPIASVGATENIMLASVISKGETIISNAAKEPEISDLANFLNKAGADIRGQGTDTVVINGVDKLSNCEHTIMPDRIEAGTFLCMAAATGGELFLKNAHSCDMKAEIKLLRKSGCLIKSSKDNIYIEAPERLNCIKNIVTKPYPALPTDIQPQITAVMAVAKGKSKIYESVFEARNKHISELNSMGANIEMTDNSHFVVNGVQALHGARVTARDLRGGAALITAALCARGRSIVDGSNHIERGYEKIEEKLRRVGADITYFD